MRIICLYEFINRVIIFCFCLGTNIVTLKEKCNLGFEIVCFEENVQTLCFNTPLDVLKHIKNSGTNGIKPLNWTVSKLKHFEDYYKKCFGMNDKVTLTYNPVYVVLKKK